MKTALVTGNRGFVGSHFVPALQRDGYQVSVCDIADGMDCRDLFKYETHRYDLVVHLAAIVGGRATIEGDPLKVATDLSIDAEMFNWAVRTQQHRIVYYSSSAAYPIACQTEGAGRLVEGAIDLDKPMMPDFTYGWAKLTGEQLARHAQQSYGLKVHVFRPFSGYGPGQTLDYPFPSLAERARVRKDPFEIWGDGRQTRDFIHITDVVAGTLAAVDADFTHPLNLCTGRGVSFNQLAALMCAEADYRPQPEWLTAAPTGVLNRVGDPTLMKSFYEPRVDLEQGIHEALS